MEEIIRVLQEWLTDPNILKFIEVLVVVLILSVFFRFLAHTLPRRIPDTDFRYRVRKSINLVGYGVIALFVIMLFNESLGKLTVIFGAVGAGIAFALQEVIVSFAGWVAISLGQFYKTGDRIQLGGIMGDVIDISLLRTTLMECGDWVKADLYNGRIVRVANSFVFKEPVFNYSGDFPFLWDEITVPIRHGSSYHLAKNILEAVSEEIVGHYVTEAQNKWERMVNKYRIDDARTAPVVTLIANDNWLEFTIRYVVDYKQRRSMKDLLFMRILEEIDATQGEVKIASATVELTANSSMNIDLHEQPE